LVNQASDSPCIPAGHELSNLGPSEFRENAGEGERAQSNEQLLPIEIPNQWERR